MALTCLDQQNWQNYSQGSNKTYHLFDERLPMKIKATYSAHLGATRPFNGADITRKRICRKRFSVGASEPKKAPLLQEELEQRQIQIYRLGEVLSQPFKRNTKIAMTLALISIVPTAIFSPWGASIVGSIILLIALPIGVFKGIRAGLHHLTASRRISESMFKDYHEKRENGRVTRRLMILAELYYQIVQLVDQAQTFLEIQGLRELGNESALQLLAHVFKDRAKQEVIASIPTHAKTEMEAGYEQMISTAQEDLVSAEQHVCALLTAAYYDEDITLKDAKSVLSYARSRWKMQIDILDGAKHIVAIEEEKHQKKRIQRMFSE